MRLMKIINPRVLKEDGAVLTFRDLSSVQVSALVRLSDGRLSYETASMKERDVLDSLINLGLVDEGFELTDSGLRAAELGKKYGSTERREAGKRDAALGRKAFDKPTDVDHMDDVDVSDVGEFGDRWGDLRDRDFD